MARLATPSDLWRISLPRNLRPDDAAFVGGVVSDVVQTGSGAGVISVQGAPYDAYSVWIEVATDGDISPALGAVTTTRTSTSTGSLLVSGAPLRNAQVRVQLLTTGTLGTASFRYSLDGGATYSINLPVPAQGVYVVQGTGITLTFVPGEGPLYFEAGDRFDFVATAAAKVRYCVYQLTQALTQGSGSVTPTGLALARYALVVRIAKGGALGVATYQASLNGGKTWTAEALIPGPGVVTVAGTGITLTFTPGEGPVYFQDTDCWSFAVSGTSPLTAISANLFLLRTPLGATGLWLTFSTSGAASPMFLAGDRYAFTSEADPDIVESLDVASDEAEGLLGTRYELDLSQWGAAVRRYVCDMARLVVLYRRGLNVGEDSKSHKDADAHARKELEAIGKKLRNHKTIQSGSKILAPSAWPSADPFEIGDGADGGF